jgi:hypothetical protein
MERAEEGEEGRSGKGWVRVVDLAIREDVKSNAEK